MLTVEEWGALVVAADSVVAVGCVVLMICLLLLMLVIWRGTFVIGAVDADIAATGNVSVLFYLAIAAIY